MVDRSAVPDNGGHRRILLTSCPAAVCVQCAARRSSRIGSETASQQRGSLCPGDSILPVLVNAGLSCSAIVPCSSSSSVFTISIADAGPCGQVLASRATILILLTVAAPRTVDSFP